VNGAATLTGLSRDDQGVVLVRPGLAYAAHYPQIFPPSFSAFLASVDVPGTTDGARVIYGPDGVESAALQSASFVQAVGDPFTIPGSGLDLEVQLAQADVVLTPMLLGVDGDPVEGAFVTAISPVPCSSLPHAEMGDAFYDQCSEPNIDGVGPVQYGDLTESDGTVDLAVNLVAPDNRYYIEAVWEENGNTFVGTANGTTDDTSTPMINIEWGVCDENVRSDALGDAGFDLLGAIDGYGMNIRSVDVAGDVTKAVLEPVLSRIVVRVFANTDGAANGTFDARLRTDTYTRQLSFGFGVDETGQCIPFGAVSGSAQGEYTIDNSKSACRYDVPATDNTPAADVEFTIVLEGVPDPSEAEFTYTVKFPQDQLVNTSKSGAAASQHLIGAPATTEAGYCTYTDSNDPRYRGDL
jgi:hypothetical protein